MSEKVWQAPVVHFDSLNSVDNASKQNETTDFASMKPRENSDLLPCQCVKYYYASNNSQEKPGFDISTFMTYFYGYA